MTGVAYHHFFQSKQCIPHAFEYISRTLHKRLDDCFLEIFKSAEDSLFLLLNQNRAAARLWNAYTKKVLLILEESGQPFLTIEDTQLNQEELSLKYSARKATILLAPISGQYPPLPLPTTSFVSTLLHIVAKYPRSIQTVCWYLIYRCKLLMLIFDGFQISRWFDGLADFAINGPGTTLGKSIHLLEHSQCIPKAIRYRDEGLQKVAPSVTLAVCELTFVMGYIH